MVTSPLVAGFQNDAVNLLTEMVRCGFPFESPVWLELPESSSWRLVILAPSVETEGPRAAYRRVRELLKQIGASSLSSEDVYLLDRADYRSMAGAAEHVIPVQAMSDQRAAPAIALDESGTGPAVTHANNSLVTDQSPALRGETIVVYVTGLGPVELSSSAPYRAMAQVRAEIDGVPVSPAFAGKASVDAPFGQVNVRIPQFVEPGKRRLRIVAAGSPSNEIELAVA